MRALVNASIFAVLIAAPSSRAGALCYYAGAFDVKTSIRQEFRDLPWVVRARVVSVVDGDNGDGPWIMYRLKVGAILQGPPAKAAFDVHRGKQRRLLPQ